MAEKYDAAPYCKTHFPPPERISPLGKLSYPFFVRPA